MEMEPFALLIFNTESVLCGVQTLPKGRKRITLTPHPMSFEDLFDLPLRLDVFTVFLLEVLLFYYLLLLCAHNYSFLALDFRVL